jgi:hypothetical protein
MQPTITLEQSNLPDSVENLFAKKFEALPRHKMDDELTKIMLGILFADIPEGAESVEKEFLAQVITKRLEALGYTIDIKAKLFLMVLTENAGMAVMYCHYLAYYCKKHDLTTITMTEFCENMFPFGFPSKEDLHKLWDDQKVKDGGNLLDHFKASESITNKI